MWVKLLLSYLSYEIIVLKNKKVKNKKGKTAVNSFNPGSCWQRLMISTPYAQEPVRAACRFQWVFLLFN